MAQSFMLKGVKDIVNYTSDGSFTFRIKPDARGGDTHQIPKWWNRKGNNITYVSCTVFDMVGTNYKMIIPTSVDTQLQVIYSGDIYSMIFSNFDAVERILFTDASTKRPVIEYLMPVISGGPIAKRIIQQSATIGSFEITGKAATETGQSAQYKSNATPDASDAVYAWTVEQSGSTVATSKAEITAGAASTGCTVQWKEAGSYDVKCVITSSTATDSPQSDTKAVTCTTAVTVGTVNVTGNTTPTAQQPVTYTANVTGNNTSNLDYAWDVIDATASVVGTGNTAAITFDAQGNATVQCIVSSDDTPDTDTDTLAVVVASAKSIDSVTVQPDSTTPNATVADNFQCVIQSNVVDATFQWSVTPDDGTYVINSSTAQATNITFNAAQTYNVTCKVSSATAQNSPVTSAPAVITVAGLPSMPSVMLGGPTLVDTLNVGKNYTSDPSDGSTLDGTTTYQWTATDDSTGETSGIGATINTPNDQNTSVTFTAAAEGRTIALRCKYTNAAYTDSPKTGKRNVNVDTTP